MTSSDLVLDHGMGLKCYNTIDFWLRWHIKICNSHRLQVRPCSLQSLQVLDLKEWLLLGDLLGIAKHGVLTNNFLGCWTGFILCMVYQESATVPELKPVITTCYMWEKVICYWISFLLYFFMIFKSGGFFVWKKFPKEICW